MEVFRAFLLVLLAARAVEGFVVTVRAPRFMASPSASSQHPTSAPKAATRLDLPSTPLCMSSYDDGSGSTGSTELGGSTEMELQELVVDFTDDGRILLEVKGVKVSRMYNFIMYVREAV